MTKVHIAYMVYDRPNYCAGPLINARRLLPEFVRRGHQVTALVGYHGDHSSATPFLQSKGVHVRSIRRPYHVEDQVDWILDQLIDCDPDLFVPNCFVDACYAARFAREAGRPTVAGHLSDDDFNWGLAKRFVGCNDEWSVSGLFCRSDELRQGVLQWKPHRTTLTTIPQGVSTSSQFANQESVTRLVYVGRLEQRQKRVHDMIQAVLDTMRDHPHIEMKIIGDGSCREAVQRQIEVSGFSDRFQVVGFIDPDRVQSYLLDTQILVLLSDFEGVPGAVMDAMACGVVPVCLRTPGGLAELVIDGQTGLLVEDRQDDFRERINHLITNDNLRKTLASNAIEHIEQGFSLNVVADRWESFLSSLMQNSETRRPIRKPRRLRLPPVSSGIDREDIRRPTFAQRIKNRTIKRLRSGRISQGIRRAFSSREMNHQ